VVCGAATTGGVLMIVRTFGSRSIVGHLPLTNDCVCSGRNRFSTRIRRNSGYPGHGRWTHRQRRRRNLNLLNRRLKQSVSQTKNFVVKRGGVPQEHLDSPFCRHIEHPLYRISHSKAVCDHISFLFANSANTPSTLPADHVYRDTDTHFPFRARHNDYTV